MLRARLNTALRRAPRWTVVAGSLVVMAAVTWLDFRSGPFVELSIFYLPPIAAMAWYVGRREGLWAAALATALWGLAGPALRGDELPPGLLAWNAAAQLLFFASAAVVVSVVSNQAVRLRVLAREDALTGISNRRAFFGALDRIVEWGRRQGSPWVLAYLDVDDFKKINDNFGHGTGDKVLKSVARTLREATRRVDVVARLGGDEFVLLLPQTSAEQGELVVEKVMTLLEDAMARGGWPVSFSIGVITFTAAPESADAAVAVADACMYRVKASGKAAAAYRSWPAPGEVAGRPPRGKAARGRSG
jgi:diguanylate cyclase (GGDEF)-like protein